MKKNYVEEEKNSISPSLHLVQEKMRKRGERDMPVNYSFCISFLPSQNSSTYRIREKMFSTRTHTDALS
jgi:hypothetical protein